MVPVLVLQRMLRAKVSSPTIPPEKRLNDRLMVGSRPPPRGGDVLPLNLALGIGLAAVIVGIAYSLASGEEEPEPAGLVEGVGD